MRLTESYFVLPHRNTKGGDHQQSRVQVYAGQTGFARYLTVQPHNTLIAIYIYRCMLRTTR